MCRNIRTLFNFAPPATEDEIRASALQFVRKLSGFTSPSKANEAAFNPRLNASSFTFDGLLKPLSLRTNCSAEARISVSVAGGSKLNSVLMLRHMILAPSNA